MEKKIAALLKKLEGDAVLQKQLSECKDLDKAFALLEGAKHGVTKEEFKEAMMKFRSDSELSEQELENVAGGMSEKEKRIVGGVSLGIGVATTAASAAV